MIISKQEAKAIADSFLLIPASEAYIGHMQVATQKFMHYVLRELDRAQIKEKRRKGKP